MSEIDKIKEEIGWLKVVFALLVAIDISLIGWAAQSSDRISVLFLSLVVVAVMAVTAAVVLVNRRAYRKFNELGDL